ncbi:6529_t:CDS:1, partial [Paraglomus brasilianum]
TYPSPTVHTPPKLPSLVMAAVIDDPVLLSGSATTAKISYRKRQLVQWPENIRVCDVEAFQFDRIRKRRGKYGRLIPLALKKVSTNIVG